MAVVEAGLGGRHDATNVLDSRVVLLTNVGLEHTDVLGETVEAIATEKLAVVHTDDTVVVLSDDMLVPLVPRGRIVHGGALEAAEAFVGHPIDTPVEVVLPGRLEQRPGEIRDGAHNPDGIAWLIERLPSADYTVCASILEDKDVDEMLRRLASISRRFVATSSSNARSLTADGTRREGREPLRPRRGDRRSAGRRPPRPCPRRARARDRIAVLARRSRGGGSVMRRRSRMRERIAVVTFALVVVAALVGIAFAAGYILGKILL